MNNLLKSVFIFLVVLAANFTFGENDPYSGYDKLTIYDSMSVKMEENGLSHYINHCRYKILTAAGGRDYNTIVIDYDPLSAYCEIKEVKIFRNGAEVADFEYDVLDYPAPAYMIYWGARQKMVALGRLEIGDEVEFITYKKGYSYALLYDDDPDAKYIPPMRGHFYDIVPFWSNQPIQHKVYQVELLTKKNLQYKIYNGDISVKTNHIGDKTTFSFEKNDIFPLSTPRNTVAASDIQTKLILTTAQNWEAKSKWFYGVNEDFGSFEANDEIRAKVAELLKKAKTENDSIDILTHWVADNIRYSGISMGDGEGYTLHKCEMTFRDRCGVCKDKAGMLIGMLRAAGFKAYAAMTMAGERIEDIPADQFNHCVTVVQRKNGNYQLLDPTWVPNVRGELWSSAEQQKNYLMGLPTGAKLGLTPVSDPKNHYIKMIAQSQVDKKGTLKCKVTITADRQSDASVRRLFSGFRDKWQQNIEAQLFKDYPNAVLKSVKYTTNDDYLKQPVKITYNFEIPQYAIVADNEILVTPFLANGFFKYAMRHLYVDTNPEKRDHPFYDACSRYIYLVEDLNVPSGFNIVRTPETRQVNGKNVSFLSNYKLGYSSNIIQFSEIISLGKRIYNPDEWSDYRQSVLNQKYYMHNPIIFTK